MRRLTFAALLILSALTPAHAEGNSVQPNEQGISLICMIRTCNDQPK